MSHYVILVIGEDFETQLEPFDENEAVPRYTQGVVSEDEKQKFTEYYVNEKKNLSDDERNENKNLSFADLYKKYGNDWNGNDWRLKNGVWEETSNYNPNSKWDWYQVGGRWNGFLTDKNGNKVNQARKGDIDFVKCKEVAKREAMEMYDKRLKAFGGVIPTPALQWEDIEDVENRRDIFHAQPEQIKISEVLKNNHDLFGIFFNVDELRCTREEYGELKANSVISPYAVLNNGDWISKGEMGWFGLSDDKVTQDDWNKSVNELLMGLDDDEIITVVDCHI